MNNEERLIEKIFEHFNEGNKVSHICVSNEFKSTILNGVVEMGEKEFYAHQCGIFELKIIEDNKNLPVDFAIVYSNRKHVDVYYNTVLYLNI